MQSFQTNTPSWDDSGNTVGSMVKIGSANPSKMRFTSSGDSASPGPGDVVTVLDKTKYVEGVTCIVVNDLVIGETTSEDTDDWYAQDRDGNVWYCGEIAKNFETFEGDDPEEAELVDIDGSWKTGRDGAKPGILMLTAPAVDDLEPTPGLHELGDGVPRRVGQLADLALLAGALTAPPAQAYIGPGAGFAAAGGVCARALPLDSESTAMIPNPCLSFMKMSPAKRLLSPYNRPDVMGGTSSGRTNRL